MSNTIPVFRAHEITTQTVQRDSEDPTDLLFAINAKLDCETVEIRDIDRFVLHLTEEQTQKLLPQLDKFLANCRIARRCAVRNDIYSTLLDRAKEVDPDPQPHSERSYSGRTTRGYIVRPEGVWPQFWCPATYGDSIYKRNKIEFAPEGVRWVFSGGRVMHEEFRRGSNGRHIYCSCGASASGAATYIAPGAVLPGFTLCKSTLSRHRREQETKEA